MEFGDTRLLARYWNKVRPAKPEECWEWIGARTSAGYGQLRVGGKALLTHRMAAEVEHGAGGDLHCLHSCDNPPCVNPRHLRWGTHKENMEDAVKRGRREYPEKGRGTHCPQNHAFTPENTYNTKSGYRACRECHRRQWREWNARRKKNSYSTNRVPRHGTETEYGWGCRCEECRSAKAEAMRILRSQRGRN